MAAAAAARPGRCLPAGALPIKGTQVHGGCCAVDIQAVAQVEVAEPLQVPPQQVVHAALQLQACAAGDDPRQLAAACGGRACDQLGQVATT